MSTTTKTPAITITDELKAAVVLRRQSVKRCDDAAILADYTSDEDLIRAVFTAEQAMHVWKSLAHFPLVSAKQAADICKKHPKCSAVIINANAAFVVSATGHEWRKGPDGNPLPIPAMLEAFPSLKDTSAAKTAKALTRSGTANLRRTKDGETPAQALCRTIARGLRQQKAEADKAAKKQAEATATKTSAKEAPAAVATPAPSKPKRKAPAKKASK